MLAVNYDQKKIFVIFLVVMTAQIIDLTIGSLADVMRDFAISISGVPTFIMLAIICGVGQYLILAMVRAKNREVKIKRINFMKLEVGVSIIQYLLIAISIFLILQMIVESQYYRFLLNLGATISYGLAACLMGILAYVLLRWYRIKKTLVVLLYGLGAALTAFNVISIMVIFNSLLQDKASLISPQSEVIFAGAHPLMNTLQGISAVLYFILFWGGTVLLLYHNIQKVGKVKFWTLVTTPVIFFGSLFIGYFGLLNSVAPPEDPASLVIPVLAILSSTIAGLVLFGLAFHSVARSAGSGHIKDFMMIAGYGFILFFTSITTTIVGAGYPPFGFVTVLLVGPFSFLILAAVYRSAITVAMDAKLRQSLKSSVRKEFKLLDSIGMSEMQKQIESKVLTVVRENADTLEHESGIKPSLTEEELHELLDSTLTTVKREKRQL